MNHETCTHTHGAIANRADFILPTPAMPCIHYLLARQTGGQFILRIEDTDQKRSVPGAEEEIIRSLEWLGIDA